MEKTGKIEVKEILKFLWMEGDLEYKLDDLQKFIRTTVNKNFNFSKKICILSSRQIGKSYWVMTMALEYLIRNPKNICRVIAPTREKCEEIVEDNLNVILNDIPEHMIAKSTSKNRWNLWNGSSLRLGALERQYVDKNRGGNASLIIYEECGFVSADDFNYGVNSVIAPQLLRSKGHEIFVSSPSEQPDHPLHTSIAPICEILGTLFRYQVFQSPSISDSAIIEAAERSGTIITSDFVSEVRAKAKEDANLLPEDVHQIAKKHKIKISDDFKREYMAEVIRPTNLMVIPTFHERQAVHEFDPPHACNWSVVIDWGGVRDKTVALLMTYEYKSDTDIFYDEMVFDCNTPTDEIVKALKAWDDQKIISAKWADVPGQLQIDLNEKWEYSVQIPQKTNWLGAVNTMAAKFSMNKVKIHPRCKFLIASIRGGLFNKTRTDFERSQALGHMDALAACMYGIRCQNKENPYKGDTHAPRSDRFVHPDLRKDDTSLENMSGKGFGKYSR